MTVRPDSGTLDLAVSDFGPIVEANVDLRPLTVFVGPSNTGKSYLAILIYAMHCFFGGTGAGKRRRLGSFIRRLQIAQGSGTPLSAESMDALAGWTRTMSSAIDGEEDAVLSDVLPEPVSKVIRERFSRVQDLKNAEKDLDAEIMRCFGVDAIEGLIRRPGRGKARGPVAEVFNGRPAVRVRLHGAGCEWISSRVASGRDAAAIRGPAGVVHTGSGIGVPNEP